MAVAADTDWTSLIFQAVFCATSATIVSGSMAERTKFKSYLVYSVVIFLFVYPISGHWIWGGGWLNTLGTANGLLPNLGAYGFHDFAGSTAVHMVGGISAFIGALILGPRIGKYGKDGNPHAIPGHSITLGCLGVFILWFGWFGFNPASSLAIDGLTHNVSRIFINTNMAARRNGQVDDGGGFAQLIVQFIGALAVAAWVTVTMTCVFQIIRHTIGLRVPREEELEGLDSTEHGLLSAYADYTFTRNDYDNEEAPVGCVPHREAVPVELVTPTAQDAVPVAPAGIKMTKIEIICNQGKFDALKSALFDIGITGMTCTNVLGCGEQHGSSEYYRGVMMEATVRPKLKVDIVVCKLPVSLVVSTAKKALYTGHIGDGKIFVCDVENVIRVRTGEEGYDALQDDVR